MLTRPACRPPAQRAPSESRAPAQSDRPASRWLARPELAVRPTAAAARACRSASRNWGARCGAGVETLVLAAALEALER